MQISVDGNTQLEVLDFGGVGRPIIFLAGMGLDAHEFDNFAPTFLPNHRVLAISRRGFGKSSAPVPDHENYSADRLGRDVLAVMAALKIDKPVLVGHSMAGEELSAIAASHPEKVSGLVYLEAGYPYALYAPTLGDPIIDAKDLQQKLSLLFSATLQTRSDFASLEQSVARFDQDLKALDHRLASQPAPPPRPKDAPPPPPILLALVNGAQKFTEIHVPTLAIFAISRSSEETTSAQADAFQAAVPQARVVRIIGANHFIFRSNTKQVMAEMNTFLSGLPN
ncbi:alpha/beta fold hydrolase [Tunturiibacter lichenicola]|uniref:alpha/beta fold hydrolase n=1 Tax=Tunturiibacter lichenicola TaxID=2051959 RepID=UPI0021B1CD30|nr:alpha/beta hydrolase [Edaphobacter lichenicola]